MKSVKYRPEVQDTQVQSLGQKIPWERKWEATSVFLPGKIPWTEEPGGLQSMRLQSWIGLKELSTHAGMFPNIK